MGDQTPPLDRRRLFLAVAEADLPMPVGIETFANDTGEWASIRLPDNHAAAVDEWRRAYVGTPGEYGGVVTSHGGKPFRAYETTIELEGWPVEVCSYIDFDGDPEAVES